MLNLSTSGERCGVRLAAEGRLGPEGGYDEVAIDGNCQVIEVIGISDGWTRSRLTVHDGLTSKKRKRKTLKMR